MAGDHECSSMERHKPCPVYNARNSEMLSPSRVLWACCLLFLWISSQAAAASDWQRPEAQLAQKIAAATGPGVIALDVTNRSSISSPDVEEIRRALTSLLATSGVRVWAPEQAAAIVKLTLSENHQNYVWVAEITQGTNEPTILMVSTPRPASAVSGQNAPPLTLRATHIVSSPSAILDFAFIEGNPRTMLVLGEGQVTNYQFKDGRWISGQSIAIGLDKMPRDSRGRILLRKDHLFDAYLPGLSCRSNSTPPLTVNCSQSDDPWPLQTQELGLSGFFAPTRNFFTGALVPGVDRQKSAPAFFSAAAVPRDKYTLWVFAGLDGQLHLLDGINQQTVANIHWGSDIAGVHANCRQGWQILATSAQDGLEDSIQAFEFPDRVPIAVSQRLAFNGSVTALWSAQDGQSAAAVYRDTRTGNYEAEQLNLDCSQ
jgi:hypothetical protein